VRTRWLALFVVAACACAGCSNGSPGQNGSTDASSPAGITTSVVSISATSQLSDMVKWNALNKTGQPQLATCEVLVLHGSTQLGELGPVQLTVAAGATAEQFSEVTTLAGNSAGDTAQIVCQKG
jgi:hypothetical protein